MRALPFTYRSVLGPSGSLLQVNVIGDCGGSWFLCRSDTGWQLIPEVKGERIAEIDIPEQIAWRIFTKGIARDEAEHQVVMRGNQAIALHILNMISIVG